MARRPRAPISAAAASLLIFAAHLPPGAAQNSLPRVDFGSLGTVGVVGSFAGLSLYDPETAAVRYSPSAATLISRSSDGQLSYIAATNEGGSISTICQSPEGKVYVGGAFSSIAGQDVANIAEYDPTMDVFAPLASGLDGPVRAIACNGSTVIAGGDFRGPAEGSGYAGNVAQWSKADKSWSPVPFAGLNGPVESIAASEDGRSVFFGGSFSTVFSNGSAGALAAPPSSSSFRSLGSSLFPMSLNTSDYVASPTTYTSGFGRPEYIFCPRRGDGIGASWLLVDGAVGSFIARMYRPLRVRGIRLGNTFYEGRGTRNFSLVSIPDNTVLTLTYASNPADASSPLATCSSNCELAHDPNVPYQDFIFPDDTVMTGFELQIFGWYGAGAGLHLMQLLSDGSYAYGVERQNLQPCMNGLGASNASSTDTTGRWSTTDLVSSIAGTTTPVRIAQVEGGTSPSAAQTLTWTPFVQQSGAYEIYFVTPGCQAQGDCPQRTSVSLTVTPQGQGAGEPATTVVDQTNAQEQSTLIYAGNLVASTSVSASVTISLGLAQGGAPSSGVQYEMIADMITLVAASTNGSTNATAQLISGHGLFEFATDGVGAFGDAVAPSAALNASSTLMNATGVDELAFSFNEGATVRAVVSTGTGSEARVFVAGDFTYTKDASSSRNVMSYNGQSATPAPNGGLDGPVAHLSILDGTLYATGNFSATADNKVKDLAGVARWRFADADSQWEGLGPSVFSRDVAAAGPVIGKSGALSLAVIGSGSRGLSFFDPSTSSWNATSAGLVIGNLSSIGVAASLTNRTASTYFAGNVLALSSTAAPGGAVISRSGSKQPHLQPYMFSLEAPIEPQVVAKSGQTGVPVKLRRSGMSLVARGWADDLVAVLSPRSNRLEERQAPNINTTLPSALTSGSYDVQVLAGSFWKNSSDDDRQMTILGGSFQAAGDVRSIGVYNAASGAFDPLPGLDVNGPVSVLTVIDDKVWVGGNLTSGTNQGFVVYDLAASSIDDSVPSLGGYPRENATVTAIATRPNDGDQVIVAGAFASAGSLPCPSVCLWDGKDRQWTPLSGGLPGVISSIDFAGDKSQYLVVAGRFSFSGQTAYIARWNFDNSTWSAIGSPNDIPGPATAMSSDNGDIEKLFIAGESTTGLPYIMYWNGTTWSDINNNTLAAGSGVQQLVFVPMSSTHEANDQIETNRMLMVSGELNINSTSVSSALYDGSKWYPYLVSTSATGSAGVISQLFYSVVNFNLASARHLSTGIVILISIAIALGIVFALVLIGLFIALARRKEESQYPGPAQMQGSPHADADSMKNFKPPTSLLATVGAATAVLLDRGNEKRGPTMGRSESQRDFDHDSTGGVSEFEGDMSYDSHVFEGEESNARARYSFAAEHPGELSVKAGEDLVILEGTDPEWFLVANNKGERGLMPSSYLA